MIKNYSQQTFHINSTIPYDFTLYRNHRSDEQSIVYYLHGGGGDERTWDKSNSEMIHYWQSKNTPMPLVAGISFGPGWILIPKNESDFSGYLEYFISNVMPFVEKKAKAKIVNRYLIGYSMGGHSAAQLVFRYPEKFQKAALISPAILPFSPYENKELIDEYILQTKINLHNIILDLKKMILQKDQIQENIQFIVEKYKKYIPTQEAWLNTNILTHIKPINSGSPPLIYISCGNQDDYGFFIGASELEKQSKKNNFKTSYQILNGRHNAKDFKAIVNFINDN